MEAPGREEQMLMFESPEALCDVIRKLIPELEKARGKKPNKEGALAWANAMEETVSRAFHLLKIRYQYPELEELFTTLAASADRADTELFKYGTNMDLPDYIN